jgi:hypothetical protein
VMIAPRFTPWFAGPPVLRLRAARPF